MFRYLILVVSDVLDFGIFVTNFFFFRLTKLKTVSSIHSFNLNCTSPASHMVSAMNLHDFIMDIIQHFPNRFLSD